VSQEVEKPLIFLPADLEGGPGDDPFVAIVRSREELNRWQHDRSPGLQWIQVEGLSGDPDSWAYAAQGTGDIPLDVVLSAPGSEFSNLYRLVDVLAVRDVRVSIPATPGFLKAVRLAASLGLPVRLLPGQPSAEAIAELVEVLAFYLHDPMVEAPIEFFHSALAWMRGSQTGSLWIIFEEDPAVFRHYDSKGRMELPRAARRLTEETPLRDFVKSHLARLIGEGAECATCPWQLLCQGYFKWPNPEYSCREVKQLFATLRAAADEIERDLAGCEAQPA
jgi:hypothetical protein